ncbi:MAG: hypothetical protein V7749_03890 [Cocleimonas sp.]
MFTLKPFIRITLLSLMLASLLIYLGIQYHWGDKLKETPKTSIEISLPDNKTVITDDVVVINNSNLFNPEIVINNSKDTLLSSMNKEQIAEQCLNLLSKELKEPLTLELATVNCVMSNHQETFQNSKEFNNQLKQEINNKKQLFSQECKNRLNQTSQYSLLENQLLLGICISDRLNNSLSDSQ